MAGRRTGLASMRPSRGFLDWKSSAAVGPSGGAPVLGQGEVGVEHANPGTLHWYTSSYSEEQDCVEVAVTGDAVLVRHAWHRDAGCVVFSPRVWQAFVGTLGGPGERRGGS